MDGKWKTFRGLHDDHLFGLRIQLPPFKDPATYHAILIPNRSFTPLPVFRSRNPWAQRPTPETGRRDRNGVTDMDISLGIQVPPQKVLGPSKPTPQTPSQRVLGSLGFMKVIVFDTLMVV